MTILTGEYLFLAKKEAAYGVAEAVTAALNAMRVKAEINPAKVESEEMDYDAGRTGKKGQVEKLRYVEGSLKAYVAGSGTAIVPEALAPLLNAAALKVTPQADHVLIELDDIANTDSVTGKFYRGTIEQTQPGARMDWEIEFSVDALPKFNFPNYKALYRDQTNEGLPAGVDLSAFKNPKPTDPVRFVRQNVFGYAASISKFTIKGNCETQYLPESGEIVIIDRNVTVSIELKEPTPDVIDFYKLIGSYGVIDLQVGQDVVDEGHIFEALANNGQLTDVSQTERNKIAYLNLSIDLVPTARNNEIVMKTR